MNYAGSPEQYPTDSNDFLYRYHFLFRPFSILKIVLLFSIQNHFKTTLTYR